jgi:hypothetical protein
MPPRDPARCDALLEALTRAAQAVAGAEKALETAREQRRAIIKELFDMPGDAPILAMERAAGMTMGRLYQIRDDRLGSRKRGKKVDRELAAD